LPWQLPNWPDLSTPSAVDGVADPDERAKPSMPGLLNGIFGGPTPPVGGLFDDIPKRAAAARQTRSLDPSEYSLFGNLAKRAGAAQPAWMDSLMQPLPRLFDASRPTQWP